VALAVDAQIEELSRLHKDGLAQGHCADAPGRP
jgi:hypothetical protein